MDIRKVTISLAGVGAASGIATAGYFAMPPKQENTKEAIQKRKESIRKKFIAAYSKSTEDIWNKKAEEIKNNGIKDELSDKDDGKEKNSIWTRLSETAKYTTWDGDIVSKYCKTHAETDLDTNNTEIMDMVEKMCTQNLEI